MAWMARHLDIPAVAFTEYARPSQTMTDHAHQLAVTLGLRVPTMRARSRARCTRFSALLKWRSGHSVCYRNALVCRSARRIDC